MSYQGLTAVSRVEVSPLKLDPAVEPRDDRILDNRGKRSNFHVTARALQDSRLRGNDVEGTDTKVLDDLCHTAA